jgi:Protein of unknown function (DUF2637)
VPGNTDDRQVWAPQGDPDAPAWAVYRYDDGTAVPPDAGGVIAARPRSDAGRALRLVALVGAIVGLAALTTAACVLSYSSIHRLATQAGVSLRLASIYPLIFDVLLVLAGCTVLALRGAGLVSRLYGWLCMIVLLGCLAAGGAVHAADVNVPRHLAGIVAAVVPWALVLIGFSLLIALLRYARIRRSHGPGQQAGQHDHASSALGAGLDAAGDGYEPGHVTQSAGAGYVERAHSEGTEEPGAGPGGQPAQASELYPAPTADDEAGEDAPFRRTRSSPTPPGA